MSIEELAAALAEFLPRHECGLCLTHNEHRDMYQTAEEYLEDRDMDFWPSEEERALAISTGEIWTLQWYPNTPVGFYVVAAASLGGLFRAIAEGDYEH